MSPDARITVHASQFPDRVRRDLLASLRARRINPKFHYDSLKQTLRWLALHQAWSSSRRDPDCAATYDRAFAGAAERMRARRVHLIGLGCGGGQKDTRLLKQLSARGKNLFYTPCDVSAAMVLVARQTALASLPALECAPFVCDLASARDLPVVFRRLGPPGAARLITFFGMIPNFEPQIILPVLAALVGPRDSLLFSANLAPGRDYADGLKKILPQYDNGLTRDWLMTFLLDLGVGRDDGALRFGIENGPAGSRLRKVVARFCFRKTRRVEVGDKCFVFRPGEDIELFFSYRYTPGLVRRALARNGLAVLDEWIAESEEEGVFLCGRERGEKLKIHQPLT